MVLRKPHARQPEEDAEPSMVVEPLRPMRVLVADDSRDPPRARRCCSNLTDVARQPPTACISSASILRD